MGCALEIKIAGIPLDNLKYEQTSQKRIEQIRENLKKQDFPNAYLFASNSQSTSFAYELINNLKDKYKLETLSSANGANIFRLESRTWDAHQKERCMGCHSRNGCTLPIKYE